MKEKCVRTFMLLVLATNVVCVCVCVCACVHVFVTALSGIYYRGPSWEHGNLFTVITAKSLTDQSKCSRYH